MPIFERRSNALLRRHSGGSYTPGIRQIWRWFNLASQSPNFGNRVSCACALVLRIAIALVQIAEAMAIACARWGTDLAEDVMDTWI